MDFRLYVLKEKKIATSDLGFFQNKNPRSDKYISYIYTFVDFFAMIIEFGSHLDFFKVVSVILHILT